MLILLCAFAKAAQGEVREAPKGDGCLASHGCQRVPRIVKQEVTHFKQTSLYTHTFQLVTLTV